MYNENLISREGKVKASRMAYDKTKTKIKDAKRAKYNENSSYKIGKRAADRTRYYNNAS